MTETSSAATVMDFEDRSIGLNLYFATVLFKDFKHVTQGVNFNRYNRWAIAVL